MALAQLNLKIPPAVLEDWRRRATEAGHSSVRAWLIATLAPAAEETPSLADRVAALEQAVSQLQQPLQARPAAPRRAMPVAPPEAPPGAVPAGGIETAALAARLGMKRGTLNARISRAGGPVAGVTVDGWECLGTFPSPRGGPLRALWVPIGTAGPAAAVEPVLGGSVPAAPAPATARGTAAD